MEPEKTQELNPDQVASSLAFTTHLQEGMMPEDVIEPETAPITPQDALVGIEASEPTKDMSKDMEGLKNDLKADFDSFKDEIRSMLNPKQENG